MQQHKVASPILEGLRFENTTKIASGSTLGVSRQVDQERRYVIPEQENFLYISQSLRYLMRKHRLVVFEKSPFKKSDQERVDAMYDEARSFWASGEIEKSLGKLDEYEREFASQSVRRDSVYSTQLRDLTTEHAGKAVLCLRGPVHYDALPILLRRDEVNFSSFLFTEPYVQPLGEAVVCRIIHGQANDDEILTRLHIYQDFVFKAGTYDYNSKLKCSEKALALTASGIEAYKTRLRLPS
jgi:hypothetical protein